MILSLSRIQHDTIERLMLNFAATWGMGEGNGGGVRKRSRGLRMRGRQGGDREEEREEEEKRKMMRKSGVAQIKRDETGGVFFRRENKEAKEET